VNRTMNIRKANATDADSIQTIYTSAFLEGECDIVSKIALQMLEEKSVPSTISLVAEHVGALIGHVAFSPVEIDSDIKVQGFILAPLAVRSEHQKRGVGSGLVQKGIQQVSDMSAQLVFVYGDPQYYSRFGFAAEVAEGFVPPYPLKFPFGWLGMRLEQCDFPKSPVNIICVNALCDPNLW
jgi:putative acetyltransferase